MPAGDAVRGQVRARHQGRAGRDRPPRALRRRLAQRPCDGADNPAPAERPQGRGDRLRPGRPDLRGRPRKARLRRDDLRGAAPCGRRARLRHPGIPSAEGDRAEGGRQPEGARRQGGDEHGHRPRADDRGAEGRIRLRGDLPRHRRGPASLHGHRARTSRAFTRRTNF